METPHQSGHTADEPADALRRHERRTLWVLTVTAVAAILAGGFSGLQWLEIHSGGAVAKEQADAAGRAALAAESAAASAKQQANIAEMQAKLATENVQLFQESIRTQKDSAAANKLQAQAARDLASEQRPRIAISFQTPTLFMQGYPTKVLVTFQNSSDFPAEDLITNSFVGVLKYPLDSQRLHRELLDPKYLGGIRTKLEPKISTYGHPTYASPSAEDIALVSAGREKRLIAGAVAIYHDEHGRLHHSYGCTTWAGQNLNVHVDCRTPADD